jgi:hypothetical protein
LHTRDKENRSGSGFGIRTNLRDDYDFSKALGDKPNGAIDCVLATLFSGHRFLVLGRNDNNLFLQ